MGERVRREDLQIVTYTHEDWVMAYSDADGKAVTTLCPCFERRETHKESPRGRWPMLGAGGRTIDTSRLLPSLRSAVAVALLLVLAACGLGDRGSTAQVEGLQYEISVARSLQVGDADLEVYGQVSGYTDPGGYPFADTTAFSLRDVDPRAALLVRWADGLRDDAGSLGEYALLYRDLDYATSGICAYFEPVSPATPPECS